MATSMLTIVIPTMNASVWRCFRRLFALSVNTKRHVEYVSSKAARPVRGLRITDLDNCCRRRLHTNGCSNADDVVRRRRDPKGKTGLVSKIEEGPALEDFLRNAATQNESIASQIPLDDHHPYVKNCHVSGSNRKVYFEVYGCQMNVNDTEIAWSILKRHGYERTTNARMADVVLMMTCSIREGAEQKVWNKLEYFKSLKRRREMSASISQFPPLKIGILGCMAERLKEKFVEKEKLVDLVAGPDSYRDLPRMLAVTESGQAAVNVLLSLDETYADIIPVRQDSRSRSAFVSIMRGCDNMCSYCIVPFTRGRERSRPVDSIVEEVRQLSDQGIKEVTLLGQNVNSYRDTTATTSVNHSGPSRLSRGFVTLYKSKSGGLRFVDLLERVSDIDPEMRIRFTSPHPKDFPDEVLHLIKERSNICKQLHLPAQSGNNRILQVMRRGYTRESYVDLVSRIRSIVPDVALTSDFICGFCGETEEEFEDTLSLLREVRYNFAYLFPYSMREKTHAFHRMSDDVPQDVKIERLTRMVSVFRDEAERVNRRLIGSHQLVLVEGASKRSESHFAGRNDHNTKVIFPRCKLPDCGDPQVYRVVQPGDYIVVQINDASSQVLKGIPLYHSKLQDYNNLKQKKMSRNNL